MRRFPAFPALVIALVLACLLIAGCSSNASVSDSSDLGTEGVVESAAAETEQDAEKAEEADEKAPAQEVRESEDKAMPSGEGFTVCIDAGHQAQGDSSQEPIGPGASETKARVTSGTSGAASGLAEYEVNLAVALKLRDYLESRGVNVVMVRETHDVNISNSERAAVANVAGADLFVRLHCDGSESSSPSGFSTLVPGYNDWTGPIVDESARAGGIVQRSAVERTGANDLGVVERTDLSGFNWCEVPTVLCEMGFMSNHDEDLKLASDEYQQLLAEGIGDGVLEYLDTTR